MRCFCHFLVFALLQLITILVIAAEGCAERSFIIESSSVVEGGVLQRIATSSIGDCIESCISNSRCSGANFLLNMEGDPVCLLIDSFTTASPSELPIAETVMYSIRSFCFANDSLGCPGVKWSFERFPGRDIMDASLAEVLPKVHLLDECLTECAKLSTCRCAFFNKKTSECRVSNVSLQNVHNIRKYFKANENVDLYESNCAIHEALSRANCQFLRVRSAGFTDTFDERVDGFRDADECELACVRWSGGLCRAYTFDLATSRCYLSHMSSRSLGRNPLELINDNFTSGDLDDCVQFRLKCKPNSMQLSGSSMKLFSGTVKSKKNREVFCEKVVKNVYEFETEMPYGECGMQKSLNPFPTFSSIIFLKEGSTELITVRDKIIQATCRVHQDIEFLPEQKLSFRLDVESENDSRRVLTESIRLSAATHNFVPRPKFKMEVLDAEMKSVEVVRLGAWGYLLFTAAEESHDHSAGLLVTDVTAHDAISKKTITLVDSDGCVMGSNAISALELLSRKQLRMKIHFVGFSPESEVLYEAIVKPCTFECFPKCNIHLWKADAESASATPVRVVRNRRSASSPADSRHFELLEDVYSVRSTRKLKFAEILKEAIPNPSAAKKIDTPEKERHGSSSIESVSSQRMAPSYVRCLTEDYSCLFTVLLICLQALLLLSCVGIVYVYVQQWRQYRRNLRENRTDRCIEYEFTGNGRGRDEQSPRKN